jgi:hypothetical protein
MLDCPLQSFDQISPVRRTPVDGCPLKAAHLRAEPPWHELGRHEAVELVECGCSPKSPAESVSNEIHRDHHG